MVESFDPPYEDSNSSVSALRVPVRPPIHLPGDWFHSMKGPVFSQLKVTPADADLTGHGSGAPIGTPIIVYGRVSDSDGRAGTQYPDRNLASQRRRRLLRFAGRVRLSAGPELYRRRALPDR